MIAKLTASGLALLLAAAPAAAQTAQRATDQEIERALFKLLQADPERVLCTEQVLTGSAQPRTTCGSVRRWFDARRPDEKADSRAPWQLVAEIKKKREAAERRTR